MKKSTLVMILCLALAVAIGVGSTMAYLQDTDEDVNVMTLGSVYITQNEQEYDEAGKLVEFTQDKPLYPAVGTPAWNVTDDSTEEENAWRQFTGLENVVDKYVTVTNTGKSDAYVRTLVALEMGELDINAFAGVFGLSVNIVDGAEFDFPGTWEIVDDDVYTINGKTYNVMTFEHQDALVPGETTIPSILQMYLKGETTTNETMEKIDGNGNGKYDVLVLSQAVQTQGFADANTALNTAFGEINQDNVQEWFANIGKNIGTPGDKWPSNNPPVEVPEGAQTASTVDELKAAIANGGDVYLTADIDMGSERLVITSDTMIDLMGNTISGETGASQGHLIMINNGATLTINDSTGNSSGKLTYGAGSSNIGWVIDVEGELILNGGIIELTGDWSIGYGVDLRPNAWGTAYTEPSVFTMNGGKIISSDGGIRVASTSSDTYKDVVAKFIMNGGAIEATYDGIFIQQSNAAYDTLSVELNDGTVTGGKYPIRFYGPDATSVNSGAAKPMTLIINSGANVVELTDYDTSKNWYSNGLIAYGGGTSLENLNTYSTIQIN